MNPTDQTCTYVVHHAVRRDLARFEAAVRATPVGDRGTWRALRHRWGRFAEVLHRHHSLEDAAVRAALVRDTRHARPAGDAEVLATLQAMKVEHHEIGLALRSCTGGFATMVAHPCTDHRNALDVHVTATRAALLDHLRLEETEALPLRQRVVTAAEHSAAEAAARGYPLRTIPFLLPWATEGLPDEVSRALRRDVRTAYRTALWLFRGRFRREESRAFRHV